MATYRGLRLTAMVVVLAGAVLLLGGVLVPWYSVTDHFQGAGSQGWYNTTYYLGDSSWNGTVRYSCGGGLTCGGPTSDSYSSANLSHVGTVAEVEFLLVIGGGAVGVLAGALGIAYRRSPRWTGTVILLTLLAASVSLVRFERPVQRAIKAAFERGYRPVVSVE